MLALLQIGTHSDSASVCVGASHCVSASAGADHDTVSRLGAMAEKANAAASESGGSNHNHNHKAERKCVKIARFTAGEAGAGREGAEAAVALLGTVHRSVLQQWAQLAGSEAFRRGLRDLSES